MLNMLARTFARESKYHSDGVNGPPIIDCCIKVTLLMLLLNLISKFNIM